jgi:hypothetical protein
MRNGNEDKKYNVRIIATLTRGWRRPIGLLFVVLAAATI